MKHGFIIFLDTFFGVAQASHFQMCRSVPQMPVLWTRIRTSLGPVVGSGISSSQRPASDRLLTSAFMMVDEAPRFTAGQRGRCPLDCVRYLG